MNWVEITLLVLVLIFVVTMLTGYAYEFHRLWKSASSAFKRGVKLNDTTTKWLFKVNGVPQDAGMLSIVKGYSECEEPLYIYVAPDANYTETVTGLVKSFEQDWRGRKARYFPVNDLHIWTIDDMAYYDVVIFEMKGLAISDNIIELSESGKVDKVVVGCYE